MFEERYEINGKDAFGVFGLIPQEGLYKALFPTPEKFFRLIKDFPDYDGTQRYMEETFQERTFDLSFIMKADSSAQLLSNYNLLENEFHNPEFQLKVIWLNRLFKLEYLSMPQFEKFSPFFKEGKACIAFTISVRDNQPTVFYDSNGEVIELVFPPDVPDEDMDFEELTFEIEGKYLILSDPDVSESGYAFNGNDILIEYGLAPAPGFDEEILKLAESKERKGKFKSRIINAPFHLFSTNELDFRLKYYSLCAFLFRGQYFNMDVFRLHRRFKLCYAGMTSFEKFGVWRHANKIIVSFTLNLIDDFPTLKLSPGGYDASFEIDENGNLILTQSDEFNDKIDFEIDENGDLNVEIF